MTVISHSRKQPGGSPRFLSVVAAARLLGVSPATLYRAIAAGEFPAVRIRSRLIVPAEVVERLHREALATDGLNDNEGGDTSARSPQV